jgi:hypothetical protein
MYKEKSILLIEGNKSWWHVFTGMGRRVVCPGNGIPDNLLNFRDLSCADSKAFELTEQIFSKIVKKADSTAINSLLNDARADLLLRQSIGHALRRIFLSRAFALGAAEYLHLDKTVVFIPAGIDVNILEVLVKTKNIDLKNIKIPFWFIFVKKIVSYVFSLKYRFELLNFGEIMFLLLPFGRFVKSERKIFKYGVFLRRTDTGLADKPNSMDFLIKEGAIQKEESIFIMDGTSGPISDDYMSKVALSGYAYCHFGEMLKCVSKAEYMGSFYKKNKQAVEILKKVNTSSNLVLRNFVSILLTVYAWEVFYSKYYVETFIGIQEPGALARALWQKKNGSKYYFIYLSSYPLKETATKTYYSNIVADKLITSVQPIKGFKQQGNNFQEYYDCGIINSAIVRRMKSDSRIIERLKKRLRIEKDTKVMSVFDNSSDSFDTMPFCDMLKLLGILIQLLGKNKDTTIVYKLRDLGVFQRSEEIKRLFSLLCNHNRCRVIKNNEYSVLEVLSISDIVITVPLSSVFTEALSAGINTVCFITQDYLIEEFDDSSAWISRIFAQDYNQLSECINYWAADKDNVKFAEFMRDYVKKNIDTFCDGQALARLADCFSRN